MGTTGEKSGIFLKNPGPVAAGTWWLSSQAWSQLMKPGTSWAVEMSCSVWQVVLLLENRCIRHSYSDFFFFLVPGVFSETHFSFLCQSLKNQTSFSTYYQIFLLIRVFLIPTPQNGIQPQFPYSPHPCYTTHLHPTIKNESKIILN